MSSAMPGAIRSLRQFCAGLMRSACWAAASKRTRPPDGRLELEIVPMVPPGTTTVPGTRPLIKPATAGRRPSTWRQPPRCRSAGLPERRGVRPEAHLPRRRRRRPTCPTGVTSIAHVPSSAPSRHPDAGTTTSSAPDRILAATGVAEVELLRPERVYDAATGLPRVDRPPGVAQHANLADCDLAR